jgi:hypothetical protein
MMKESRLVSKARTYLEKRGCRFFGTEVAIGGGFRLDLVGIRPDDHTYVVECKLGSVNRPAAGLGKLLFYRELVLENRQRFRSELRRKLRKQNEPDGCVAKIRKRSIRYYLILTGRQPFRNMTLRIGKRLNRLDIRVRVL